MRRANELTGTLSQAFSRNLTPGPTEDPTAFCKRLFGGGDFECSLCGVVIHWPGVCDDCDEKLKVRERPIEEQLIAQGVPSLLSTASFQTFELPRGPRMNPFRRDVESLRTWNGTPSTVFLSGPPGTGKSHLAVAAMRRVLEAGRPARFVSQAKYLREIRDSFEGGEDIARICERVRVLVFDDLGSTRTTDFGHEEIVGLLIGRHENRRTTIITTNLTLNEIADRIDGRLASRLQESLWITTEGLAVWRAHRELREVAG